MKKEDWVLLAPVVATQCIAFYFAHRAAPSAYMDEIFHVPQAQQYCQGNFHGYDAQLTTPPGLYLVSAALHTLGVPCTLLFLRLQSLAIGLVILPALCSLLNPSSSQRKQHSSWLFAVMPLFSFFSLIYYTDLLSTSLVLATLVLLQRDWTVLASTAAFASLWVRQTNVVWVFAFVLLHALQSEKTNASSFLNRLFDRVTSAAQKPFTLISRYAAFIPVGVFAVGFLAWNGSIVLGDRSNHIAGFHPVQMLWMMSFCVGMNWPLFANWHSINVLIGLAKRPLYALALILACYYSLRASKPHPFVLADNRHYTFYINRWVLSRLVKPFQAFFYASTAAIWLDSLSNTDETTACMIVAASFLTLIPSPLLEFRYYLIPYLLWSIAVCSRLTGIRKLALFAWFLTVQIATVALFVLKPFEWVSEPGVQQHFMW